MSLLCTPRINNRIKIVYLRPHLEGQTDGGPMAASTLASVTAREQRCESVPLSIVYHGFSDIREKFALNKSWPMDSWIGKGQLNLGGRISRY